MSAWKTVLLLAGLLAILVALYPSRQLGPAAAPDEDVVEITYMGPGGPISGTMVDAVRLFEKESQERHARDPQQPVYRVISGQNASRQQTEDPTRFVVSVAGGEPPDVIFFDRYAVAEWAARGAFEPLDDFIASDLAARRDETPAPERFFKPCWEEAMYQGRVYGIPISVDDRALFYNKDLLQKAKDKLLAGAAQAGLAPDEIVDTAGRVKPPASWEALRLYTRALTERDEQGDLKVVGFAPNYGNSWLYIYGWMNGGRFMDDDRDLNEPPAGHGSRCTLNDPRIAEALAFMTELYDTYKSDPGETKTGYALVQAFQAGFQGGTLDPFIQGKVAMKIDGVWTMRSLAAYGQDLNFGVAPPPMPQREIAKGRRLLSWCGGWALAIPSVARHKQAAWELVRFLTSERSHRIQVDAQKALSEAQGQFFVPGQMPLRELNEEFFQKYVVSNPTLPPKFAEGCRTFNDLLPYSRYRPVTPVGQLLWNKHIDAMEAGMAHTASPQQALDVATLVVQRDLDRFYHPVAGEPIRSWKWFFTLYAVLLAALAAGVYLWDTRLGFRQRVARLFGWRGDSGVVEGSRGGFFRQQWYGGWICAAPWMLGFIVFAGGPMLFSIVVSFSDFDILNPPKLIGLHNFRVAATEDELFWKGFGNTLYMILGVPIGLVVSLAVALLLNLNIRGMAVWRTLFYLPAIVPMVAASVLWIWIFNPQGGFLNQMLGAVGLKGPLWLQDTDWSKPSLILMGLWSAGAGMIIWLAGLKGIPKELYEAADVDGASEWRKLLHITLPQLTPYIFFNLVMGLIGTFQIFGSAFIMTGGGPQNSTLFYVYYLFNQAFRYGHMGYAAAMAWFLFVIVLGLTIVQMKLSKRWVYYEAE